MTERGKRAVARATRAQRLRALTQEATELVERACEGVLDTIPKTREGGLYSHEGDEGRKAAMEALGRLRGVLRVLGGELAERPTRGDVEASRAVLVSCPVCSVERGAGCVEGGKALWPHYHLARLERALDVDRRVPSATMRVLASSEVLELLDVKGDS